MTIIHLQTIIWEGVHRFHQTTVVAHDPKKSMNPWIKWWMNLGATVWKWILDLCLSLGKYEKVENACLRRIQLDGIHMETTDVYKQQRKCAHSDILK